MSYSAPIHVACSNCNLRELCMPTGVSEADFARLDELVTTRRKVKRRAALFRAGEPFTSLYAIRTGVFKTCVTAADGRDQVTGFQMAGEIMGLDGIVNDRHSCDAVALEDAEVCVLPFARVAELAREVPVLQQHLHRIMSREIVREHGVMMLLGNMSAEERVAAFLLNLALRMEARGFSGSEMVLRMSRQEIGNYLGLTLETVSRTFTRLAQDQLLEVNYRCVRILDLEKLRTMLPSLANP
jgi:CRP/FNR family transcriptional regulator